MEPDISPGAFIGYFIYVLYTCVYVYNRLRGKSAQFVISRVNPSDPKAMKIFTDVGVAIAFIGFTVIFLLGCVRRWCLDI